MALPREPRQKMINMMYLVLTALLALNVSSEILNAFKTVNRSLENTNLQVDKSTVTIMKSLQEKTTEPVTRDRAVIWYPKAEQVVKISKKLFDYIDGLKKTIIKDATKGGKLKEDNLDVVTRLMIKDGEGKKLLAELGKYKNDIMAIDPEIKTEFEKTLNIDLSPPPGRDGKTRAWEIAYFNMIPTVAGLTILSKFQNDVKTTENKVVSFCHTKVGEVKIVFDSYAAIVGQNSNYLMPGQELVITAGVGAYSKASKPTIEIAGQTVELGENGYAEYKTTASGGNGERKVHVKIAYFNQITNKNEVLEKDIPYTIGSANASIALEKMNVLYIGVNNPVSISASGGGDDRTQVSISGGGGQIQKLGGGKYNVRVGQQTDDCRITVSVDGKQAGAAQFRVRQIPGAVATVGGAVSGENMTAAAFKAQGGVAAWIKDFPFELKYSVTSYTISTDTDDGDIVEVNVQGNAFSADVRSRLMPQVKANKTVYIDNIRVIGEDGQNRKVPSILYYIK